MNASLPMYVSTYILFLYLGLAELSVSMISTLGYLLRKITHSFLVELEEASPKYQDIHSAYLSDFSDF